ncbi:phage tail protein [Corallococcus sp. 4LFB]|uniref:phage tail protein n=1 Tax=Corallococcus sp. 4LFB TaxID=3383249 RepID=UPI0039756A2A
MKTGTLSSYLKYLPALFWQSRLLEEPPAPSAPESFLGRFLLAFEHILSRPCMDSVGPLGLEKRIERGHKYINVDADASTPFLPWLAGWVATRVSEDMSVETQREVIKAAVCRHQCRGTKESLQEAIELGLKSLGAPSGSTVAPIKEATELGPKSLGAPSGSTVAPSKKADTTHAFAVEVFLTLTDPKLIMPWRQRLRDLIAREKPAHTYCQLRVKTSIVPRLWELRKEHPDDSIVVGEYLFPLTPK